MNDDFCAMCGDSELPVGNVVTLLVLLVGFVAYLIFR